ncbi:ribosome-associated complex protein SSZ1 [Rhodotorula paludigena]|uniref:ribosome-associated complex protein SSZ1 n=1 Tax=Rhodotorula paludigena TaxID=86838 RepID=UPI00317C6081
MPPKRNQKGSKQSSKAPSKAASKAPSGASTPRAVEPQTPVKLAPGLLGLNFGQSFSSVAIIDKEGLADCIANDDGERQIATALSFSGSEKYSGVPARVQLVRNAQNTILAFRNLLGKTYAEVKDVKQPCNSAPIVDANSQPGFTVEIDGQPTTLTAHDCAVRFLRVLLSYATDFLGRPITDAVLTVPSDFSDAQVQALLAAAQEAGVKVVQTIPEAAAALTAYAATEISDAPKLPIDRNTVVLDVGATSTIATVVAVRDGLFHPLASASDRALGGDLFDEKLMDWFGKEFTKKTKVTVEPSNHRAQMKLRLAVEVTKKSLSASTSAPCSVESLADGLDFHGTVNRMRFDLLASSIYARIVAKVREAVEQAQLDPLDISEIVLVGGTTKLPSLANKLLDVFAESTVVSSQIEPDEVVSKGAALQAQSLVATFPPDEPNSAELVKQSTTDATVVAPLSLARPLGFVLEPELAASPADLAFVTLVAAHTPLPARRIVDVPVESDAASEVVVALWEGEGYVKVTPPQSKLDQAKGALAGAAASVVDAVKKATGTADEDDFSDDEEEEEDIRTAEVRATKAVADLVVPVDASKKDARVRITVVVDAQGKGHIEAHQLVDGAKSVEKDF